MTIAPSNGTNINDIIGNGDSQRRRLSINRHCRGRRLIAMITWTVLSIIVNVGFD